MLRVRWPGASYYSAAAVIPKLEGRMTWLKDLLWLVGIALAIGLVAIVIVVLVAWFALGWRTTDKIADALF